MGGSSDKRMTTRPWRRLRGRVLKRDKYLCVLCAEKGRPEPAVVVDHIEPVAMGGKDHEDNLRSLCGPCHYEVTVAQFGLKVKPVYGDDGWPVEVSPVDQSSLVR